MAPSFIDDAAATCATGLSETCAKTSLHKASGVSFMDNLADDGATTDIGQSSASDNESSSGASSSEGYRSLGRRCRFGVSPLETIPATPSASQSLPVKSPPGFSRAAMREARDSCVQEASAGTSDTTSPDADAPASTGITLSRFGETSFGTVPKTPVGNAKWKNLKGVFGSPPGLSKTERRRERDACKGVGVAQASWGSSEVLATGGASGTDRRQAAHGKLAKMKGDAALLKDLTHSSASESDTDFEQSASQSRQTEDRNCRFDITALGTMPSTPARKEASISSPPGMSRKTMRQARDACVKSATSWGAHKSDALTINASGKPMTPPTERAARQRAARDAMTLGSWGVSMPALPKASEMPR